MKKRLLASLLAFVIMLSWLSISCAAAEEKAPTKNRSAFEFCELYTKRRMEFNAKYGNNFGGIDTDIRSSFMVFPYDDEFSVSCSGGVLMIDKTDFTIQAVFDRIIDLDADKEAGYNVIYNALIIISALEENDLGAQAIEMLYKIDKTQPEDIYMKYLREYNDIIFPTISANVDKLEAGEEVLIYQGNYDYYARYRDNSDGGKYISLYAAARE